MNILQAFSLMIDKGEIIYRTGDDWGPQLQCVNGYLYRRHINYGTILSEPGCWYMAHNYQFSFEDVNADDWEVWHDPKEA